jgi:predicted metal-dependent HD superfamily phosphohydrolase
MTAHSPPRPGTLWQHWKGGLYRIDTMAVAEDTHVPTVVYRPLSDPAARAWTRPLPEFVEPVLDLDGRQRARFVPIELPDDATLRATCARVGVPDGVVRATLARYREPQRVYHAAWHVHDVFARASQDGLTPTRAQALALLFHDAVYVAGADPGINERLSAMLLRQALSQHEGFGHEEIEHACAMVMDTATHRASSDASRAVIALDLATLGDPPERFDAWTEFVWLEYRHLFAGLPHPRRAFLERRIRVLDGLLATARDEAMDPGFLGRFAGNVERVGRRQEAG